MGDEGNPEHTAQKPESAPVKGLFEFENNDTSDQFNLRPRNDRSVAIPDDQRKISYEVYEARNILKLLQEQGAFKKGSKKDDKSDKAYDEFIKRITQAAEVGCVSTNVDTMLASKALEQIRADIVRRKGRHITYDYLLSLGLCGLGGIVFALLVVGVSEFFHAGLTGYGWVIMGAMAGAWLSVAAGRREVSFDGIPDFLNYGYEPIIRMVFVAVLSSTFALFLKLKVLEVAIAGTKLENFDLPGNIGWALAVGLVAGIGERALSVQLVARAQNVLSPGNR